MRQQQGLGSLPVDGDQHAAFRALKKRCTMQTALLSPSPTRCLVQFLPIASRQSIVRAAHGLFLAPRRLTSLAAKPSTCSSSRAQSIRGSSARCFARGSRLDAQRRFEKVGLLVKPPHWVRLWLTHAESYNRREVKALRAD